MRRTMLGWLYCFKILRGWGCCLGSCLGQGWEGSYTFASPAPGAPGKARWPEGEQETGSRGEEQLTRMCDFGWVPKPGPRQATEAPGGLNNTVEGKPCGGQTSSMCQGTCCTGALQGWVFYHPPCFLQKLGLEVRGQRLATRFHRHQGVVCSQASTEHFAKVPLKQPGVPTCLPWTVGLSCTRSAAHSVPTSP